MSASDPVAGTIAFTLGEREYIRRELGHFFSTLPSVADGFQLRTWRGGPQAGQPKVPLAAKGLLDRGLMRLEPIPWPPRLFFTNAGLAALRAMMSDGRLANPKTFAHVRRELGIDPDPDQGSAAEPSEARTAFPPPPKWDNSLVPTERNAQMARRPKIDIPSAPGRRGRKQKAVAVFPAAAPAAEDGDTASGAMDASIAAPAENSTPAPGRRGRKPKQQADAVEPALPLAAGVDRVAAVASPSTDGPERPCCTELAGSREGPTSCCASHDTDGGRAPKVQHPVEYVDGDGDLGILAGIGLGMQTVADDLLEPADRSLDPRSLVVAGGFLPTGTAIFGDTL